MNKYESVIIVNPNVDEAGLKALEEKFTGLINENGKVESVENMGKKKISLWNQKIQRRYIYVIQLWSKTRFYNRTRKSIQNYWWHN